LLLYDHYLEVSPLDEPVGALGYRWSRMFLTATAWLSGGILPEADGLVSHVVFVFLTTESILPQLDVTEHILKRS
jgi:hypothetical protein